MFTRLFPFHQYHACKQECFYIFWSSVQWVLTKVVSFKVPSDLWKEMSRYFSNSKVYSILGYFFSKYSVSLYIILLLLFFNWIYLLNNSWLTTKYNLFVSLSVWLCVYLPVYPSDSLSVCWSVCLSVKLFLHFFVCMTVGTPLESSGTLTNAKAGVQIGKLEREC